MRKVHVLSRSAAARSKSFFWNPNRKCLLSVCFSIEACASNSSADFTPPFERINVSLSKCFLASNPWHNRRLELDTASHKLENDLLNAGDNVRPILDEKVRPLLCNWMNGFVFLQLIGRLARSPSLALEVLKWRRKQGDLGFPMVKEEYTKIITIAGRLGKVNLAIELFNEACDKGLKSTPLCNSLLGSFMYNCYPEECLNLFKDMKNDSLCSPSIVTINMIMSVLGRTMFTSQLELVMQEIVKLNLYPTISTFNVIIESYLISWMWESMETTYAILLKSPIELNTRTYVLMVRGYALSGQINKMEEMYRKLKDSGSTFAKQLYHCMICAYLKSSVPNRVEKAENLLRIIREDDYYPWLNVLMIKFYAEEDLIEKMDESINEAFERSTRIVTLNVMKAIIAAYFRFHALEKLTEFVRRAEIGGWRLCKSLYHCKMIMCGGRGLLQEMESVLREMNHFHLDINKKTLIILFKCYLANDHLDKVKLVVGYMHKNGFHVPCGIKFIA